MSGPSNPYLEPASFGLELMADLDLGLDGEYDMVCVWRHAMTGIWYAAADTGDCHPVPFDDFTGDHLTPVFTLDSVADFARDAWRDTPEPKREHAVNVLVDLVKAAWRKAGVR
ncbi:DUF7574 domain-containing protein [Lentzea kentuckyensis]|uniref:DUF7574 domain-containing protein n=1 Tax=Lentzea kentuckyensis TaxID=360086 RepID=UPI000A3897F3|nr:hypothetical protein [Lentzea kentuckyensis]